MAVRVRFIKKILERGTVTVPSDVREAIGVEEGDIVEFQIIRVVKRHGDPTVSPEEPQASVANSSPQTRAEA